MKTSSIVKIVAAVLLCVLLVLLSVFFATGFGRNVSYTSHPTFTGTENLAKEANADYEGRPVRHFNDGDYKSSFSLSAKSGRVTLGFGTAVDFNTIILREKGFNVKKFYIYYSDANGVENLLLWQDKIEDYRYIAFPQITAVSITLEITEAIAIPKLIECEVFNVPKSENEFKIAGYLTNNAIPNDKAGIREFDHDVFDVYDRFIYIGGARPNLEDGSINQNRITDADKNPIFEESNLKISLDEIRRQQILRGRTYEVFVTVLSVSSAIIESPYRNASLKSIAKLAEDFQLDGIDFDWEFPVGDHEFEIFGKYIIDLKAELNKITLPNGKTPKISLALYGWGQRFSAEAIEAIDLVNIMGYDQNDQDSNGASFLGGVIQPIEYLKSVGFSEDKLMLGMPFYSSLVDDGIHQIILGNGTVVRDNRFDNVVPEITTGKDVYINSPQMVYDKTAYCIARGLPGIFCWHIGADVKYRDGLSLLRAQHEAAADRLNGGAK